MCFAWLNLSRWGHTHLAVATCGVGTPSPRFSAGKVGRLVTITTTAAVFWKNCNIAECVLREISGVCVDTKPRNIEASSYCGQQKPEQWPAKRLVISCVRVYKTLDDRVNQKLTKACPEDAYSGAFKLPM